MIIAALWRLQAFVLGVNHALVVVAVGVALYRDRRIERQRCWLVALFHVFNHLFVASHSLSIYPQFNEGCGCFNMKKQF